MFDCTGHPSGLGAAIALARKGGTIVMVGYASDPVPLDSLGLLGKELRLLASTMYTREDFAQAIEYLATDRVPCDQIITSVRHLEDAPATFDDLTSGKTQQLKVLLHP